MNTTLAAPAEHAAAVVWLDLRHALVARAREGHPVVTEVERDADPESAFLQRVVHEAADCDRVVIMGPDDARIDFEREYVAVYHRPDRLIDVGVAFHPAHHDLVEQLELIEPALGNHAKS
jgi:hypothetical protein